MPKTKRDKLKRIVAHAYNDHDRALANLLLLKEIFSEHHPQLAAGLEVIMQCSLAAQVLLRKFWEASWGKCPDDLTGYM